MLRDCEECGKGFEVDTSKRNWQHVKVCSSECHKARAARVRRERYQKQEWPQEKTCIHCGGTFLVEGPGGKPQKYCSRKCYYEKKSIERAAEVEANIQPRTCKWCGEVFTPTKYNHGKQVFCSNKCYFTARRLEGTGKKFEETRYSNRNEFQRAKRELFKRDGKTCRFCGKAGRVYAHHLDNSGGKVDANNDPNNLIVLCHDCHRAIHNITLVPSGDGWAVSGRIFDVLGLSGQVTII